MAEIIELKPPIDKKTLRTLRAGQKVAVSGSIFTARDMAHKRLCELIKAGGPLPFDLSGAVIYYVGPTPARAGTVIGAAGPTTSARMDSFSGELYKLGLAATIGKGYRGRTIVDSLKEFGAVHLSALGGAGALLSEHIKSAKIIAFADLGTEAIRKLEVEKFPAIVAYDTLGNSVYNRGEQKQ